MEGGQCGCQIVPGPWADNWESPVGWQRLSTSSSRRQVVVVVVC